jgi:hypothetical protein
MLAIGLDDRLAYFRVDLARLDDAVDRVLDITRSAYPSLKVPSVPFALAAFRRRRRGPLGCNRQAAVMARSCRARACRI